MDVVTSHKIRPAGRHLLTIGRELIHDNYAAVVELVKNAYDADSAIVNIKFRAFDDQSGYTIVISDYGHGMSNDDVLNKWLVPSTQDKLNRQKSPSGRILQGSKGVGRYAASILGNDLHLKTVSKGEKTTVDVDWSSFERAQYLDDVEIIVKTSKTFQTDGTELTIKGNEDLLLTWEQEQFKNLRNELKKLKSPISDFLDKDEFKISLKIENFPDVDNLDEYIEPYPLINLFDYRITGKINENGKGVLTYSSQRARNMVEEEIAFDNKENTGCGELDLDIRVYDREADAIASLIKRGFKDESGDYVGKNEARHILNMNNGIGVYRSGFRLRPLGDIDFDWLKLNNRRVQNPSMRIGNNQVIGYVQIQSEHKSGLIEKSARDGLKENKSFSQLKVITTEIIKLLEIRRFNFRMKAGLSRSASKVENDLQTLFSFEELKRKIKTKLTNSGIHKRTIDDITQIINVEEKQKNKAIQNIREAVAVYQSKATLGQLVNVIFHEGGRPIQYFKNQLPNLEHMIKMYQKTGNTERLKTILTTVEGFSLNLDFFIQLFNTLDPLISKKRGAKKSVHLKKLMDDVFSIFKNQLEGYGINTKIKGTTAFKILAWEQDLYTIFTNLVDNSIYWISKKESDQREITIEIMTDGEKLLHIDYRDTGPGIEPNLIESGVIFEPSFTTKPDGMGLGLAIASEAAKRNNLNLMVFESENGVYFRLQCIMEDDI